MTMTVEQALAVINSAQTMLRELDAGLRKARAQDWADAGVPHEMAVAGRLVRDHAFIEANNGLNEVYKLLRAHVEREVTDEMVARLKHAMFKDYMAYNHALMNPHTSDKFWISALTAALGGKDEA